MASNAIGAAAGQQPDAADPSAAATSALGASVGSRLMSKLSFGSKDVNAAGMVDGVGGNMMAAGLGSLSSAGS